MQGGAGSYAGSPELGTESSGSEYIPWTNLGNRTPQGQGTMQGFGGPLSPGTYTQGLQGATAAAQPWPPTSAPQSFSPGLPTVTEGIGQFLGSGGNGNGALDGNGGVAWDTGFLRQIREVVPGGHQGPLVPKGLGSMAVGTPQQATNPYTRPTLSLQGRGEATASSPTVETHGAAAAAPSPKGAQAAAHGAVGTPGSLGGGGAFRTN